MEKLESLHVPGGNKNGTDLVENRNQKLNIGLPCSQAIPLLGMLPERDENKDALYANVNYSNSHNSQNVKTAQMAISG